VLLSSTNVSTYTSHFCVRTSGVTASQKPRDIELYCAIHVLKLYCNVRIDGVLMDVLN
jgi:hypothetical protein